MAVLAAVSSTAPVFLVIGLVVGFIAYRSSESYKRTHGVTPWRMPSLVWGLIGFLSLVLCAVLFLIASRTTKPVAMASPAPGAPVAGVPAPTPSAGWYPDPSSIHEFRYWDGVQWTDRVEDGGVEHAAGS